MNIPGQHPNLLPKTDRMVRVLQGALGMTLAVTAMMAWATFMRAPAGGQRTASIGQVSDSPTLVVSPTPAVQHVPRMLTTSAANSLALGIESDTVRYYDVNGKAYSADLRSGMTGILSDKKIPGFIRSWWLPGVQRVISQFQTGTNTEFRWYDYTTATALPVGNNLTSLAVSPDGRSVAFLAPKDDHAAVFVGNADGTAEHAILQTRIDEGSIAWQDSGHLSLLSRRPDRAGWDLTLIAMDGTLTPLLSGQENLAYRWSRDGTKLLYSSFISQKGIELFMLDMANPSVPVSVGLATSADKCAWSPDGLSVVCGVPTGTGLSQDIPAAKTATTDAITMFGVRDGTLVNVWTPKERTLIGVIDPLISSSGDYFVFPNLFDRDLYTVSLP